MKYEKIIMEHILEPERLAMLDYLVERFTKVNGFKYDREIVIDYLVNVAIRKEAEANGYKQS